MSWWKEQLRALNRPRIPPDEAATSQGLGGRPVVERPRVFDPALKHFGIGLRPEDPLFENPEQHAYWHALQMRVMSHVLGAVESSRWSEHLVLRGSALMRTWFGTTARPPKDLDFVVVPKEMGIHDGRSTQMLRDIVTAVTTAPCAGVELLAEEAVQDDIWTYDRVPGTRLVFRWSAYGVPWGATQLDFVFNEELPTSPEVQSVTLDDNPAANLLVASKSVSLAWKLLWLHSDSHPRGKDLYDAMVLSEDTQLPRGVTEAVFSIAGEVAPDRMADFCVDWMEWVGFREESNTTAQEWRARLETALIEA